MPTVGLLIFSTVEKIVGIACPWVDSWLQLTGSLLSPTSEMLDPHVLTYWRVRCAKRAASDFLDRREKRRHRVPFRAHSWARASERGAVTGDPVWPTSEMLDRCSRIGMDGAATDFLDRREKRRHRVPLRAHSRARAPEPGAVTGCHDQQPGLADLEPEICTFEIRVSSNSRCSICKKPQARSRNCDAGPL